MTVRVRPTHRASLFLFLFLSPRDCLFGQPFPAVGDASQCGYGISYGGGSSYIQGQLVVDEVTVGGYTVNNTIVYVTRQVRAMGWPLAVWCCLCPCWDLPHDDWLCMFVWWGLRVRSPAPSHSQQIPPNSFNSPPVQGIIGFAGEDNAVNPTYAPTVFSQIVAENPSVENLVGSCTRESVVASQQCWTPPPRTDPRPGMPWIQAAHDDVVAVPVRVLVCVCVGACV